MIVAVRMDPFTVVSLAASVAGLCSFLIGLYQLKQQRSKAASPFFGLFVIFLAMFLYAQQQVPRNQTGPTETDAQPTPPVKKPISTPVMKPTPEEPPPPPKYNCYPNLPAPVLTFTGREHYVADGEQWTRFLMTVSNRSAFPPELFTPAPDFPPCGNQTASRTSVDLYERDELRLEGFCSLSSLNRLSFGVPIRKLPPFSVYIILHDHRCNLSYSSNLANVPESLLEEHQDLDDQDRANRFRERLLKRP